MTHPHLTDASRDDILDLGTITPRSRSEEAMDRPQVVTKQQLQNPPAEQTTNLQRGQAFAHDGGVWAGFAVFPGGASTGWHHHGDYATYGYITSGGITVEFGPGGRELVEIGEGDFIYIPGHLVHRESVAPAGGAGVAVRVGGVGATVFNVEGPDPAT
jgi:uncharacterized RmlC-like cupin family protein